MGGLFTCASIIWWHLLETETTQEQGLLAAVCIPRDQNRLCTQWKYWQGWGMAGQEPSEWDISTHLSQGHCLQPLHTTLSGVVLGTRIRQCEVVSSSNHSLIVWHWEISLTSLDISFYLKKHIHTHTHTKNGLCHRAVVGKSLSSYKRFKIEQFNQ